MSTACFSGLQTSLTKRWRDGRVALPRDRRCPRNMAKRVNRERPDGHEGEEIIVLFTSVSARFLRRGTKASDFGRAALQTS